jgi:FkbM family methyltransferase
MKTVRHWFKSRLSWVQVPILGGPLKGNRIGLFAGARFVKGNYGGHEAQLFLRQLKPGDIVLDVGAHVGYYTLLASRIVHTTGKVVAFEPSRMNLKYLRQHIRTNGLQNVQLFDSAVGRKEGWLSFECSHGTGTGRLDFQSSSGERVRVCGLDELYRRGMIPAPTFIKMDIEGAEVEALPGAAELIWKCRPTILLSTHGAEVREFCEKFLRDLGYELTSVDDGLLLAKPRAQVLTAAA